MSNEFKPEIIVHNGEGLTLTVRPDEKVFSGSKDDVDYEFKFKDSDINNSNEVAWKNSEIGREEISDGIFMRSGKPKIVFPIDGSSDWIGDIEYTLNVSDNAINGSFITIKVSGNNDMSDCLEEHHDINTKKVKIGLDSIIKKFNYGQIVYLQVIMTLPNGVFFKSDITRVEIIMLKSPLINLLDASVHNVYYWDGGITFEHNIPQSLLPDTNLELVVTDTNDLEIFRTKVDDYTGSYMCNIVELLKNNDYMDIKIKLSVELPKHSEVSPTLLKDLKLPGHSFTIDVRGDSDPTSSGMTKFWYGSIYIYAGSSIPINLRYYSEFKVKVYNNYNQQDDELRLEKVFNLSGSTTIYATIPFDELAKAILDNPIQYNLQDYPNAKYPLSIKVEGYFDGKLKFERKENCYLHLGVVTRTLNITYPKATNFGEYNSPGDWDCSVTYKITLPSHLNSSSLPFTYKLAACTTEAIGIYKRFKYSYKDFTSFNGTVNFPTYDIKSYSEKKCRVAIVLCVYYNGNLITMNNSSLGYQYFYWN